jgi:hypothetical protein
MNSIAIALARGKLYNEIDVLDHLSIRNASLYRKYAISTSGRGITLLTCTYQIDGFEFMEPPAPVFLFLIRRKHRGMLCKEGRQQ